MDERVKTLCQTFLQTHGIKTHSHVTFKNEFISRLQEMNEEELIDLALSILSNKGV